MILFALLLILSGPLEGPGCLPGASDPEFSSGLRASAPGSHVGMERCESVGPGVLDCGAGLPDWPDTVPSFSPAEEGLEELLQRAREARGGTALGIESYEARVWERMEVGLTGSRFRRLRTLWEEERAASLRWQADGDRYIRWEGARQASPVAGLRSDQDEALGEALTRTLSRMSGGNAPVFHEPGGDRILFGSEQWALHPLADTADAHYRYSLGDTLRVTLPPDARTIALAEVRVAPRRADPRLVAGSLWFDLASAELVRAAYRPARPIRVGTDFSDESDGDPPPRFLRSIQLEIRQVTVDYSLQEMEWWLPHRFALEAELQAGQLLQIPAVIEWRMDGYRVNQDPTPELVLPEAPEGWTRTELMARDRREGAEEGDSVQVVTLVPPLEELHTSPLISPVDRVQEGSGPWSGFTEGELAAFRAELDQIMPPATAFSPRLSWGLEDGLLRYNRVEGLGAGLAGEVPLMPGWSGRVELRTGVADRVPGGELRIRRGGPGRYVELGGFRRLTHTSDWDDPLGFTSSLSSLLFGSDHGEYYRAHGVELGVRQPMGSGRLTGRLFVEGHRSVERNTDFHLQGLFNDDTLRVNRLAEESTWVGGAVQLRGHVDRLSGDLTTFGSLGTEVAWGSGARYQRVLGSGGLIRRFGGLEAGVEVGAGGGWGDLPPQREFYLGGTSSLRGVRPASVVGESFWFSRLEIARTRPAARLALFGDLGWAGSRADWGSGRPERAVGAGLSVMDGFVRGDLARRLGSDGGWRMHFYLDGIL